MNKSNDILLHYLTRITVFFVFIFSIYLFFAGHNQPGGGFIGGLMTACTFLLLFLNFDREKIKKALPFAFTSFIAIGLLLALGTGAWSMLFNGEPFLTHYFDYFELPFLGETELTSALPFDLGIYLIVVGIAVTITLAIAEDDQ
ncbi:Na(+)/H(+) antiporter subunit B [Alkalicoccobacillus gibsonii]|jgi:multicomponent Na+:H+ antiporter subunit B|uniref:Na(+)/H(+) antiporter subunit B n=1 Tax=Alkalicoccobacillus gibsonii TaxID=79881 RepID=UPI001931BFEB|nr:Na(+)/H(+) antiporter subunit B [Alkalicoccobacillus gibsonii]MBM0064273.1 Na(+)/H(+) antiporter subunit B [Alkalicoccobacillus gibsonii]